MRSYSPAPINNRTYCCCQLLQKMVKLSFPEVPHLIARQSVYLHIFFSLFLSAARLSTKCKVNVILGNSVHSAADFCLSSGKTGPSSVKKSWKSPSETSNHYYIIIIVYLLALDSSYARQHLAFDSLEQSTTTSRDV